MALLRGQAFAAMWKCFKCEELNWDSADWCHKCEPKPFAAQAREQADTREAEKLENAPPPGPDDFDLLTQAPIVLPIPGLPPFQVDLKVPSGTAPSILQMEMADRIREDFPRLWSEVLQALQATWGEEIEVLNHPAAAFTDFQIIIPPRGRCERKPQWDPRQFRSRPSRRRG